MIFHTLVVKGGSVSAFLSLALELQNLGHTIDIYCYYFDPKECFPELSSKLSIHSIKIIHNDVKRLNGKSIFNRLLLGIDYYFNARQIFPLMGRNKYDVILASEACAYVPALIYKKKYATPVYWSVFDPLSLVDRHREGMIINQHKWFEYVLKIHNTFDTRKIHQIDKVIVSTKKMKERVDRFYNIDSLVLPLAGIQNPQKNSIKFIRLIQKRLQEKFHYKKGQEILLLTSGHFLEHRRYEDIVHAVKILIDKKKSVRCIISGSKDFDPAYFGYIQKLIIAYNLESYISLDSEFKSNDEMIGYYMYCDIFLFVGSGQNWGLAPLEAMSYKKPVIITQGVEVSEIMKNEENAIIIDEKNPKKIAEAIQRLMENKSLANILRLKGYELSQQLTYTKIAKKLIKTFSLL